MKKSMILMAAFVVATSAGVLAQQTPATQNTNRSATTMEGQNAAANTLPYSNGMKYSAMEANTVPSNVSSAFGTEYNGVNGAKWESNNDVYRSTFQRDGKDMSVTYDKSGKVRESRTAMQMTDFPATVQSSFQGKSASMPYEIMVGNQKYYSAQVGGKEVYYDSNGKSVTIPNKPRR